MTTMEPKKTQPPKLIPATTPRIWVPNAIRKPVTTFDGLHVWLYGEPKIGKTTIASKFPGVWFLATEQGQAFVECHEPTIIGNWEEFVNLVRWIYEAKPTTFGDGTPIRTLCIDTLDLLFGMCENFVCKQLGVEDPGELDHGKGWKRLTREFYEIMGYVTQLPYGLVTISHSRQKSFKTRGTEVDRWEPDLGASGMRWGISSADLIMLLHSQPLSEKNEKGEFTGKISETRQMLCQPQSWAVAGGRMSDRLPHTLRMNYDALVAALQKGNE